MLQWTVLALTTFLRFPGSVARTLGFIVCACCSASASVPVSPYITPWFKETWHSCSECQNQVAMRRQGAAVAIVYGPGAEAPST